MKKKTIVDIGDVLTIPISDYGYGYIRAYNEPYFIIFQEITTNIVSLQQISNFVVLNESVIVDDEIVNGNWQKIGNIPFEKAENAWPSPRKQPAPEWNPTIRFVFAHGKWIPDSVYGKFDELPDLIVFTPEKLIAYMKENCIKID